MQYCTDRTLNTDQKATNLETQVEASTLNSSGKCSA